MIVPAGRAYVVERLGKFHATLSPGLHLLIPFVDRIAYAHDLRETFIPLRGSAVSRDNVILEVRAPAARARCSRNRATTSHPPPSLHPQIDADVYVKISDPVAASYGVTDAVSALSQLAMTTMRSECGKATMDMLFVEREHLGAAVVAALNEASASWGTQTTRFQVNTISPPASVRAAMELQAEAERRKRAEILESEGAREAAVNRADGSRRSVVLAADGEAAAILARARATAEAVSLLGAAVTGPGGNAAVSLRIAEQYVAAFGKIAKSSTTLLLPANAGDAAGMVANAMAVWGKVSGGVGAGSPSSIIPGLGMGGGGGVPPQRITQEEEEAGADNSTDEALAMAVEGSAESTTGGSDIAAQLPFVPKPI